MYVNLYIRMCTYNSVTLFDFLLHLLVVVSSFAECDQTFVSRIGGPQNGTFSAPLLHNQQNDSRQCLYTFLAGPGQRVEVVFKSFNLRGNPPEYVFINTIYNYCYDFSLLPRISNL